MGEWAVTWTCFSSLLRWFILNSLACQGPQVQGLSEVLIFPRQDFWELLTWVGSRSPVAITPASVNLRVVHLVWPFFLPPPPYFHISVYFVSFMHAYDELCSSSHSNTLFHTPLYPLFLSVSPPTFSSSSQLPWCVYDSNNHIISWKAGPFPPLAFAVFAVPVLPCSLSLGVGVDTLSRTEDTALTYSQNCGQLYTIALTSDSAKRSFSHQDGEKCWPRDKHI